MEKNNLKENYNSIEEENGKMRERKKTLQKKLGVNKEFIEESDLTNLMQQMKVTIDKTEVKQLFDKLDVDKTGKVSLETLMESIVNANQESSYAQFFKQINEELTSKSERIILKLKKLKEKAYFANDGESLDDFDWIISAINEDIYEPSMDSLLDKSKDLKLDHAIDWLTQTTKAVEMKGREKDIVASNKTNTVKKLKTTSFFRKNSSALGAFGDELLKNSGIEVIEQRKGSNLSDISQSIVFSVQNILDTAGNFDFNIFELNDLIDRKTLHFLAYELFNRYNFFEEVIDERKYKNFLKDIINGYDRNVVYHNDLHAGDVMQTVFVMIDKGGLVEKLKLNEIDVAACLLSAMCHDFKHNGYNNMFHINDKSPIAITYNDTSVLESFHVAETFKVMIKEENNLLCNLQPEEWRLVRRRMIDCILATDMANHAKHLATLKTKLETFDIKAGKNIDKMIFPDNVAKTYENQQLVLGMCVHTADISNPAKPAGVNKIWVDMVFVEFFTQGDLEKKKGLPVSLLCDRETTNVNKSQIGFINFVVSPTFDAMMNIIPEISPYMDTIKANLKRYEALVAEDEKKK